MGERGGACVRGRTAPQLQQGGARAMRVLRGAPERLSGHAPTCRSRITCWRSCTALLQREQRAGPRARASGRIPLVSASGRISYIHLHGCAHAAPHHAQAHARMQWARWMNALRQAAWKQFAAACLKTSTGSRMPRKQDSGKWGQSTFSCHVPRRRRNLPRCRVFEPRFRTSMIQRQGEEPRARTGMRRRQENFLVDSPESISMPRQISLSAHLEGSRPGRSSLPAARAEPAVSIRCLLLRRIGRGSSGQPAWRPLLHSIARSDA